MTKTAYITLFTLMCLFSSLSCGGSSKEATVAGENRTGDAAPPPLEEPSQLQSMDGAQIRSGADEAGDPLSDCATDGPLPKNVKETASAEELHALGQSAILNRKAKDAVAILTRAEKKQPKNPSIIGDLATALLQCRLFDEAIERAEKAAKLAPKNVDIAANLAQTYQIAGRIGDAVDAYREALKQNPDDAAIHNNLAVLLVLSDLTQAEAQARIAINLAPKEATYLVNLGYILFRKKRLVDAEIILGRAIEVDAGSADAHNQLGLVLVGLRRENQAIKSFERALKLNPDHRAAKENLAAMKQGFDFTGPWDR